MKQTIIKEVKIDKVEFENGKPFFAVISIDSWNPSWGSSKFSIEGGIEISIHGDCKSITKQELDLIFSAWERVVKLDFSNVEFN